MPLFTPHPPHECLAAFSNGLPAFLSGGLPNTVASETFVGRAPAIPSAADVGIGHGGPAVGPPKIPAILQAFVLSLREAANNTGVISPAHAGWRFFAGGAQEKTVLGSVVQRRHAWKLVAVHYGNRVWETLNASQQLKSSPPQQVQVADYDLRLLAIPGLNLEVFWLSAHKAGSVDLILPLPGALAPVFHLRAPAGPLEISSFLAEIRPLAASLLTMAAGYGA
jgi:hypothetical protein